MRLVGNPLASGATLPTLSGGGELASILLVPSVRIQCGTNPCIDPIFGPTASVYPYWSASTITTPNSEDSALEVGFWAGYPVADAYKAQPAYVRAVR